MTAPSLSTSDMREPVLLVRTQSWYCAIPIRSVTETCRPLPTQRVDGVPAFVRGIAVLRGQATPVLHLGMMLAGISMQPGKRFVAITVGIRPAIIEVDETLGVRRLSRVQLESTTSLISGASVDRIDGLGVLDGELLAWLDMARLVQDDLLDLVLSEGWA